MIELTELNAAAAAVFAGLGLVALAMTLLARAYSVPVLTIGLIGLLALAGASTWLIRVTPQAAARKIKDLKTTRDATQRQLDETLQKLKDLEAKPIPPRTPPAPPPRETEPSSASLAPNTAKQEENKHEATRNELKRKAAEVERLREQVDALRAQIAQAERREAHRQSLAGGIDNAFYSLVPLAAPELVPGRKGAWYAIRLKVDGTPLVFADREFRAPEYASSLADSMNHLTGDVLAGLPGHAKHMGLYLRGSADARTIVGPVEPPGKRSLTVRPRLPSGSFATVPQERSLSDPIVNDELPALRADWLRELIRPALDQVQLATADMEILENHPADGQERTAEIILFVDW